MGEVDAAVSSRNGSRGKQPKLRKIVDSGEPSPQPECIPRSYQLEALEKAKKQNTIVFLETGAGKTLIAVLLLRSYSHFIRKPSEHIAVFLVPTVVLVQQQAEVLDMHTDLKVGKFWGEMGVDFWSLDTWKEKLEQFEAFVMTPQILLNNLRHTFFKLDQIKLLIFDECHHARGKDPYVCIMMEFYHAQINSNAVNLPRIFGMTASLTNTKGSSSPAVYGKKISELENLMHSKVYTVPNESVLAKYISFPNLKIKLYSHLELPDKLSHLVVTLETLKVKHVKALRALMFDEPTMDSSKRKISKLCAAFLFCLNELGLWLALKASESLSNEDHAIFFWGQSNDRIGEQIVRKFSQDAYSFFTETIAAGWCIGDDLKADVEAGFLTSKVSCLIQSLLDYRTVHNLRCIIFVQRVVTAIVLQSLLREIKELSSWGIQYMAGNRPGLQSQTRNEQMGIVDAFRDGNVNVIIATQILEEGLDVQSCNLVLRFDPAANVCSFIQSRGRARMQGSDYLLIVRNDDSRTLSEVQNYINSGDIMRGESRRLASLPCKPLKGDKDEDTYRVESTGATVNVNSSVALIYFYCSRLPSDGYFKPHPRFVVDEDSTSCTLHLPKCCPVQFVKVNGICSMIRQIACLEACKKLHQIGALSDHLIPVIDDATEDADYIGPSVDQTYKFEEENYFPGELVSSWSSFSVVGLYQCYKISINCENFLGDIFLVVKSDLGSDFISNSFSMETTRGSVTVQINYFDFINLNQEQVFKARRFQVAILNLLIHQDYSKFLNAFRISMEDASAAAVYLLIPSVGGRIDWCCVDSFTFSKENKTQHLKHCCTTKVVDHLIQIYDGRICRCMLHQSVVYTPHNGNIYCITGILDEMDINSSLKLRSGEITTYRRYFFTRYGLTLKSEVGTLLAARRLYKVQNNLLRRPFWKDKVSYGRVVEVPAELCIVLMSPISTSTLRIFSFIPSVMHRFQCMLLAARLKKAQLDHCVQNTAVNPMKVLEAITTKKCREEFSLESLETIGDSFLKYVASQYLFKTYQHYHQGLLSARRERMISNSVLCMLGRSRNISGFIRTEEHEPKHWIIPGEHSDCKGVRLSRIGEFPDIYNTGKRFMRSKVIADSVEALTGAYLIAAGEVPALFFLNWLGLDINHCRETFIERTFLPRPELHVNINDLQLLLNYTFRDPSLLVEALTHGSYQMLDIPRCYQRLEFLGDSVMDYLITMHLYRSYPRATPGLLTDLRSASVNNDCYAHAAAKVGLNKHILHASSELHRHMTFYLKNITRSFSGSSYGWESGVSLPKVLADVVESIAGAIYVDSGSNKEHVWESIRPLLEPLVSPDTMEINPVRELEELCSQNAYTKTFTAGFANGLASITVEVEANDCVHRATSTGINKKVAKKLAVREVLQSLKASIQV